MNLQLKKGGPDFVLINDIDHSSSKDSGIETTSAKEQKTRRVRNYDGQHVIFVV